MCWVWGLHNGCGQAMPAVQILFLSAPRAERSGETQALGQGFADTDANKEKYVFHKNETMKIYGVKR
jgi:hypothetical protein